MVQRPEWLRIHQQVYEKPREGAEGVSSKLTCGTGHLPNLISTPAKAHGCNVQLMLIESLESQHIRGQDEASSSSRAMEG